MVRHVGNIESNCLLDFLSSSNADIILILLINNCLLKKPEPFQAPDYSNKF